VYALTVIDGNGCSASDTMQVTIDSASNAIGAHIARTYHLGPGSTVDIVLDDPLPDLRDLYVSLRYDPSVVQLRQIRLDGALSGSWTLQDQANDRRQGCYTARVHASSDTSLSVGTLLHLTLSGYVDSADSSTLDLGIELPDVECLIVRAMPGLVRIDSLCGLSLWLIEVGAEGYTLDGNRPNPFNPTTEIAFSIGLDGPTRLEIFDAAGRSVAMPIDEHLEPGRYIVTWDASRYPSGIYYYRLTSGAWSRTGIMTLMK